MLPTPSTSHVSFDTIYEPAEDSFLFLDTLSGLPETEWLQARLGLKSGRPRLQSQSGGATMVAAPRSMRKTPLVVELGTGSGVLVAFLAAHSALIFGEPILTIGVDVNWDACLATEITVRKASTEQNSASVYLGSICGDLCGPLLPKSVDVLVFNPPYVPTPDLPALPNIHKTNDRYEGQSHLLSLSYAGGKDGMQTTNRLLATIPSVLSRRGVAYVLLCAQNKPAEVKSQIHQWTGNWRAETIGRSGRTAGWEKLEIVRIWREAEADRCVPVASPGPKIPRSTRGLIT